MRALEMALKLGGLARNGVLGTPTACMGRPSESSHPGMVSLTQDSD